MLRSILPAVALLALAGCGGSASTPADPSAAVAGVSIEAGPGGQGGRLPYMGAARPGAAQDSATSHQPIPPFHLRDQQGRLITNASLRGKVYVTDFFFATCPGICPQMQREMTRVYQQYKNSPQVVLLSHTIDPQHDTQSVLLDYASRLGAAPGGNWRFARTSRDSTYALARAYATGAVPDAQAPGGIAHSGTFALVDDQGYVRGLYDGLSPEQTNQLLHDLPVLLQEVKEREAVAN